MVVSSQHRTSAMCWGISRPPFPLVIYVLKLDNTTTSFCIDPLLSSVSHLCSKASIGAGQDFRRQVMGVTKAAQPLCFICQPTVICIKRVPCVGVALGNAGRLRDVVMFTSVPTVVFSAYVGGMQWQSIIARNETIGPVTHQSKIEQMRVCVSLFRMLLRYSVPSTTRPA